MRTVSTLCATGSIVGAASVGCVFYRATPTPSTEQSHTSHNERHETAADKPPPAKFSSYLRNGSNPSSRLSTPLPLSVGEESQDQLSTEQVGNGSAGQNIGTRHSWPPKQYQTVGLHVLSRSQHSDVEFGESPPPTQSRLKRFPSLSRSRGSSPGQSTRPDTKSLTASATSGTPFLAHNTPTVVRPPNKLVKRSLSQNPTSKQEPHNDVSNRRQTLDRPATRHKRLATLSQHPWAEDADPVSTNFSVLRPWTHQPFFKVRAPEYSTASPSSKGVGPVEPQLIRRIYPDATDRAGLTVADSAAPVSVGREEALVDEKEPFVFARPPSTSSSLGQFFSSPIKPSARVEVVHPEAKSKRPFSISDLLSAGPSPSNRPRRLKLRVRGKVATKPLVSMEDSQDAARERPSKRRNNGSAQLVTKDVDHTPASQIVVSPDRDVSGNPFAAATTPPVAQADYAERLTPVQNLLLHSRESPSSNRYSTTLSDLNSSQLGSDFDGKVFSSADEDDGDGRSATPYDSLQTRGTRSSIGFRGPPLETFFDDKERLEIADGETLVLSSPPFSTRSQRLAANTRGQSAEGEVEGISTPSRTVEPEHSRSQRSSNGTRTITQSGMSPRSLNPGSNESGSEPSEEPWSPNDNDDWDVGMNESYSSRTRLPGALANPATPPIGGVRRKLSFSQEQPSTSGVDSKVNLFQWSEQASVESGAIDSNPTRPTAVQGNRTLEGDRASRSIGRRLSAGSHPRSQSVPVFPDLVGNRAANTSKFGTWGIGSKGIPEDWNADFDFDEEAESAPEIPESSASRRSEREPGIFVVPDNIKTQESNVLTNIGFLKEWGLLIEELKELRERIVALGLETDEHANLFDEVDSMIDLADQDAEDDSLPSQRPPNSSPGFDFDDFGISGQTPPRPPPKDSDVHQTLHSTPPNISPSVRAAVGNSSTLSRPRQNSEAVAQTVIQALQQRKRKQLQGNTEKAPAGKVPFDTQTLRDIVPYVSSLTRKVKQILREAEGLEEGPSSDSRAQDPPFSQAFIEPGNETHGSEGDGGSSEEAGELISRLRSTNLAE